MTASAGGTGARLDPELMLPPAVPVSRDSTVGVAVMAHLRRQTAALLAAHAHVGEEGFDAVHASRVAARRLRSGLRIYGDLLADDAASPLRRELAWYAGVLSPARDLEVFEHALATDEEDVHGFGDALLPWVRRRCTLVTQDAASELAGPRARALHDGLIAVSRAPRFVGAASKRARKVLAPRVLAADDRATRQLERLSPDDPSDFWHSGRISAKRARYAAEVGAPALGRACEDLAKLWSTLTEPLGDAQDAVIQRALVLDRVDDTSSPLSAGEAFVCGVYVASTHDREVSAQQRAYDIWNDARADHAALRKAVTG